MTEECRIFRDQRTRERLWREHFSDFQHSFDANAATSSLFATSFQRFFSLPSTIRPPRTVAPTTKPALISTKFLMIYCPSKVGAYGIRVNVSVGKSINGVIVPIIWVKSRNSVTRKYFPVINPIPISVSQIANTIMDIFGCTIPNVSLVIVSVAI